MYSNYVLLYSTCVLLAPTHEAMTAARHHTRRASHHHDHGATAAAKAQGESRQADGVGRTAFLARRCPGVLSRARDSPWSVRHMKLHG